MSRSKKNWDALVDKYGNYDFASILQEVEGVTYGDLEEALSMKVSIDGDVMSGGLYIENELGYAYAIQPIQPNRPAGTTEFTRNGRVIAEQYWDIGEQRLNFNVRDVNGIAQTEDSLEIGRDRIRINAECDLNGDLFVKGESLTEALQALSSEINYQVGLLEAKVATKYNKSGGDISGSMGVVVSGDTKLTINRLGVTLGDSPTQNFHAATKKYVDDTVADSVAQIDFTGVLKFLGVRDLTTVDPDGDEIVGNSYVNDVEGAATGAWGLTGTISRGAIVALGENGWIVIGEVGVPDLSGFITKVESDAKDDALDLRLLDLEADPISKTESDDADALLSGRLDTLEADFITKTESEADDLVLSNRIDAIEGDYVQVDIYAQDLVDLNDAIALKVDKAGDTMTGLLTLSGAPTVDLHAATKKYVDDGLDLKIDETDADDRYLPKLGATVNSTSDVEFRYYKGIKFVSHRGLDLSADNSIKLYADAGVTLSAGEDDDIELQAGVDTGKIKLKGETVISSGPLRLSNQKIRDVGTPTAAADATTKQYVDDAIANLGDVLTFKGTVDFTTDAAPDSPLVGDVYANTGTGAADASWGLTGDVAPGEMYGRGESQWGLIGSSQVDLTGYATETYVDAGDALALPKLGATVSSTSDVNFTYTQSLNFNSLDSVRLSADGKIRLDGDEGIELITDSAPITIYGTTVISGSLSLSDNKINNVGTPTAAKDATNKQYVDDNFLGLNFNNLPVLS